jgi:hypothetical protein
MGSADSMSDKPKEVIRFVEDMSSKEKQELSVLSSFLQKIFKKKKSKNRRNSRLV